MKEVNGLWLPDSDTHFAGPDYELGTRKVAFGLTKRRRLALDVGAHVAAFPQLVAGPIERARDLLPQLERRRRATARDLEAALGLLLWGLVQKLVIADTMAVWVDAAFATTTTRPHGWAPMAPACRWPRP